MLHRCTQIFMRAKPADDLLALRVVLDDDAELSLDSCHLRCKSVAQLLGSLWPSLEPIKVPAVWLCTHSFAQR